MSLNTKRKEGFGTIAVHSGLPRDKQTGALSEQICLATTFEQPAVGTSAGGYVYSRSANPNRQSLERSIAALEGAAHALVFSSGLAATTTLLVGLASNAHIVCMSNVYSGTYRYITKVGPAHNLSASWTMDVNGEEFESLIQENTKLVWVETPTNPTLSLVDIQAVVKKAHEKGLLVVVDNTFLSPYLQRPLEIGADIVLHSVTKYINGHSDVLMGAIAFNSNSLKQQLGFLQNSMGGVPSPFDCWLAHRGIKTLHIRVRQASDNALKLAQALEASPFVLSVSYPGLASHPQRHIAQKQHHEGLGGGMIYFRIRGGGLAARKFCESTRYFTLAESLGGVESLCEIPAQMTHNSMPSEEKDKLALYEDAIRLSIGIEDAEDLLSDIQDALKAAA